ncbi:hypothetical protein [Victivallis vadensis]|uniref:hypothetical protein n=1 Tax=Victivallis vadensis TaxID=172901 RepID=UPI00266D0925|nr:hypothetical protein [Victivallis vadensis]
MIQERIMQILRAGGNVDYECGREAAKRHIAEGNPGVYDTFPALVKVFGPDWVNGYFEYRNAWAVLNRP